MSHISGRSRRTVELHLVLSHRHCWVLTFLADDGRYAIGKLGMFCTFLHSLLHRDMATLTREVHDDVLVNR